LAESSVIERALPVFARSALATELLARYPSDIAALFGPLAAPTSVSASDRLRHQSHAGLLRNVGRTLLEGLGVWEVLAEHTRTFDDILTQALASVEPPAGLAVFAVGRLATCELDVVSDADLLFVRSTESPSEDSERTARSLVALLSGYTREGSVIAVDARLRPHGGEGELVVSSRRLARYFESEAEAWEVIAFAKLRYICGDAALVPEVTSALELLRQRYATEPTFAPQLRSVRKRLEAAAPKESYKNGPGGLYDIDFLLGLLEARAGLTSAGQQATVRLSRLRECGALSAQLEEAIRIALELYRRADHAVRIVEGRSLHWLPENDLRRAAVLTLLGEPELEDKLRTEMGVVRSIFNNVFDAASG
jgi:glutamate-ammonia-ligase adenylyltransferase